MALKRILPCLDIKDGRVVKGQNFQGIQDVSDPLELAQFYNDSGADELVLYDITASLEERLMFMGLLKRLAKIVSLPVVVGGGIANLEDVDKVMQAGAHKISINSAAVRRPEFIEEVANHVGKERTVLSIDIKRVNGTYKVFTRGGKENTGINALEWAVKGQELGAGELVLNSIDTDGVREGFDLAMLRAITEKVSVPVIASGGAGNKEHFLQAFRIPGVDGGLAASIFHNQEVNISELKQYLAEKGVNVSLGRQ